MQMTYEHAVNAPHVLVVEDDREISDLVCRFLASHECRTTALPDGRTLLRQLEEGDYDVLVLDLMLPGEDGLTLCQKIRNVSAVPIIMLTAKAEEVDRILGLEMGADDYLTKPFSPRELLARIRAVLRRSARGGSVEEEQANQAFEFGGWRLMPSARRLDNAEKVRVPLTSAEFELLAAFCRSPGRVLSRERLLDLTTGRVAGPFERSIDILVSRLRQKIEPDPRSPQWIVTVRSSGYMFTPPVTRS